MVVLIHKQSGQPLVTYDHHADGDDVLPRVMVFPSRARARDWLDRHDAGPDGEWYEIRGCYMVPEMIVR